MSTTEIKRDKSNCPLTQKSGSRGCARDDKLSERSLRSLAGLKPSHYTKKGAERFFARPSAPRTCASVPEPTINCLCNLAFHGKTSAITELVEQYSPFYSEPQNFIRQPYGNERTCELPARPTKFSAQPNDYNHTGKHEDPMQRMNDDREPGQVSSLPLVFRPTPKSCAGVFVYAPDAAHVQFTKC